MKCVIPEISWHNREPVLCIDVHPINTENEYRIATGGADYHILIWTGNVDEKGCVWVQVECDLTRHQKAINALRWSPDGSMLASADDDGVIFIWVQKIDPDEPKKIFYVVQKTLRGHKEDIYDICWSPKSDKIFSGSIDNTAILWDVSKGKWDHIFVDHKGFVQGVCYDPKGQYIATLSSDRYCRIIDVATKQVKSKIIKGLLPVPETSPFYNKEVKYFHDDTFKSYFRRFGFSPDGNLFITPSGFIEADENTLNLKCAYLFTLDNQQPVGMFPFDNSCTLAAKFSPILYELSPTASKPIVNLPYRMVFAIAAETDILLYDTQQLFPFGRLKNVHYTRITDLSWSSDGRLLVASSSDGFCTLLSFIEGEIGEIYQKEEEIIEEEKENSVLNISGIEEMEPMEIDEAKKSENEEKKSTFLLQWANKASENNKSEEKINVLSVRRTPRVQENNEIKENEVIEIKDSPVKNENKVSNSFENVTPKRVATVLNLVEDVKTGKNIENTNKSNKKLKKDHVKSSPLLKFFKSPKEKPKIKPVLDDSEARDAWKCDGDKNKLKNDNLQQSEMQAVVEEISEITVPDLDLKLESSVSHSIGLNEKIKPDDTETEKKDVPSSIIVPKLDLKLASSVSDTSLNEKIKPDDIETEKKDVPSSIIVPKLDLKLASSVSDTTSLNEKLNPDVIDIEKDKKPRRVALITLSSPKHTNKKKK